MSILCLLLLELGVSLSHLYLRSEIISDCQSLLKLDGPYAPLEHHCRDVPKEACSVNAIPAIFSLHCFFFFLTSHSSLLLPLWRQNFYILF